MKEVEEFYNSIKDIKYGWYDKKGNLHTNLVDGNFTKDYKMQKVKDIRKNNHAICWEMCELERIFFKKKKIKYKTIFILSREDGKYYCHTFLAFKLDKYWYHFEASWKRMKGIHKYEKLEDLLEYLKENFSDFIKKKDYDRDKITFYEYKKPRFLKSCNMYYFHCMHSKKIMY